MIRSIRLGFSGHVRLSRRLGSVVSGSVTHLTRNGSQAQMFPTHGVLGLLLSPPSGGTLERNEARASISSTQAQQQIVSWCATPHMLGSSTALRWLSIGEAAAPTIS